MTPATAATTSSAIVEFALEVDTEGALAWAHGLARLLGELGAQIQAGRRSLMTIPTDTIVALRRRFLRELNAQAWAAQGAGSPRFVFHYEASRTVATTMLLAGVQYIAFWRDLIANGELDDLPAIAKATINDINSRMANALGLEGSDFAVW